MRSDLLTPEEVARWAANRDWANSRELWTDVSRLAARQTRAAQRVLDAEGIAQEVQQDVLIELEGSRVLEYPKTPEEIHRLVLATVRAVD